MKYKERENQLKQFDKWADFNGLNIKKSGEFEHHDKETHMAYLGYKAGQQSKQAEVDELQKRIDEISLVIEKAARLKSSNYLLGEIGRIIKGNQND